MRPPVRMTLTPINIKDTCIMQSRGVHINEVLLYIRLTTYVNATELVIFVREFLYFFASCGQLNIFFFFFLYDYY